MVTDQKKLVRFNGGGDRKTALVLTILNDEASSAGVARACEAGRGLEASGNLRFGTLRPEGPVPVA